MEKNTVAGEPSNEVSNEGTQTEEALPSQQAARPPTSTSETADSIAQQIQAKFPEIENIESENLAVSINAAPEQLKPLCKYLHENLSFEHITDLAGVDKRTNLAVVYFPYSYKHKVTVQIQVDLPKGEVDIDTVSDIWGGANWHEREAYDMFGIKFTGHPWLKRILLPEDFEGHPLLKSYKLKQSKEWNVDKEKALALKERRAGREELPQSSVKKIEGKADDQGGDA